MNSPLEQDLRDAGADLTLTTPAAEVLDRGDRLKARRRRTVGVVAAGVLGLAAVTSSALLPTSRSLNAPAAAAWSGESTNVTADQIDQITEACGWDAAPLIAELRGDVVQAYFVHDGHEGMCELGQEDNGKLTLAATSFGPIEHLREGNDLDRVNILSDYSIADPDDQTVLVVFKTSSDLAALEMNIGDQTVDAFLSEGRAFIAAGEGYTRAEVGAITFTAYDADGNVLGTYDDNGDPLETAR